MDKNQLKRKCDRSYLTVDLNEYASSDQITRTLVNQGSYQIALLEDILHALKEPKVSVTNSCQEIKAHEKQPIVEEPSFLSKLKGLFA